MATLKKDKDGKTTFAMESAKAAEISPEQQQAMQVLFSAPEGGKMTRRNMPAMIKPGDVPLGGAVSGEIIAVVNSPVTTVKGKLLHIRHSSGQEFTFPCTGVIRNALAPGISGDDGKELQTALEKEIGKIFVAKRLPDKQSNKFKKSMFMFDVYTSAK